MPKLATLIDDFQDGVIDVAKWTIFGTVVETAGRAKLTPSTGGAFLATLATNYDLTDSQVVAHIPVVTSNGSTGTLQCGMVVEDDANNQLIMKKFGSELRCRIKVGGVETALAFTPYSAVNHLFWRIRVDASNVYWETSATGSGAFFIQHTMSIGAVGFPLTSTTFYLFTIYSGVEAFPGTFQIESVNPGLAFISDAASTSSGSLDLITTTPGEFVADGASTSTGSLALTLVLSSVIDFAASGASVTTGNLDLATLSVGTLSLSASAASTSSGDLVLTIPSSTPPATPGGTWFFEPPVAYDNPPTLPEPTRPRYLNAHAKWKGGQRRGRSVLKHGSVYTIVDTPTVDQMAAADIAYQGGHIYEVTAEEANALFLAGFNVYHGTDYLTTESGDFLTTEAGDILEVEYSFGSS